jgi:DNA-binding beta-propeller fold protein YncE/mono/diheme cytochrome c family protein
MRLVSFSLIGALVIAAELMPRPAAAQPDYTLFESDPVRPIALSPDRSRLFVVNTPGGYLQVFDVSTGTVLEQAAVPVGLEPVAVAARTNDEVWVVNHLSDSVSIVDLSVSPPRVVRTLLVGDEPRDIVFAGPAGNRAFITTAHRGQHSPYPDGDYDVPGIGRADVWVFNATSLGSSMGGTPLTIVTVFGDRPRALAVTPDGSRVYAAVYRSGNQTTPVSEGLVCDINQSEPCTIQTTSYPGRRPQPWTNINGTLSRETGMMVGFDPASGEWRDELDRNWNNAVPFSIPDLDVFEIDANASVPVELGSVPGVGTILFNMIVNPANGNVYVTNTDANNRVRFEGVGAYAAPGALGPKPSGDPPSVRGNLHKSRITVLDASGDNLGTPVTEFSVVPRHLNKHINYGVSPQPLDVKYKSVATPLGMAITNDGSTLYVAAFGSDAVAVYDTAALENDSFVPNTANMILVGEQPSGLALDDLNGRLYVAMRKRVDVIDTSTNALLESKYFFTPEDYSIRGGRKFLYNARLTSSNGEASCAVCHLFGDNDDLSWDLGDPDGSPFANPNPSPPAVDFSPINDLKPFDPLKGPMTTQSLRGLSHAGPMHWRGDRTGGSSGGDPLDENAAFNAFNVAFPGLVGRDEGELDPADMQAFTTFALQLTYPPNPIRALDNSLDAQQQAGLDLYMGRITDTVANCNGCHELDRTQGFFGTGGGSTFESETMEFKVAHLRNAYQKVGMFGQMPSDFFPVSTGFTGDQVRSTGFLHDGSVATVFNFLSSQVFSLDQGNPRPETERRALEAFIMAFETDLAPIVGQQVTLTDSSGPDVAARITLLIQRADTDFVLAGGTLAKECDLIVKGVVGGEPRGWVYIGGDQFDPDRASEAPWSRADLEAAAAVPGQPLTFTCVPPGSGVRMGINRDRDTQLDGDDPEPGKVSSSSDCRVGPMTPEGASSSLLLLGLLGWLRIRWRRRVARRAS